MNTKVDIEWEIKHEELELKKQIGKGSFGVVKLALWRGTDVAVKILHTRNNVAINTSEFDTEMNIISKLHHPNILQFLGSCASQNPYIIVMEHMSKGSLYEHISGIYDKALTYNMKINIVKDIAKGLAYLHNRKPQCIIHRDLKPSNILLTVSYKAKISDFGISCLQAKSNEIYKMTGETGTYRFMAPEVMKHSSYSTKVDIWSFGMVIYNIFVENPYLGLSLEEVFDCISKENIPLKKYMLQEDVSYLLDNMIKLNDNDRWDSLTVVDYCNKKLKYSQRDKYRFTFPCLSCT